MWFTETCACPAGWGTAPGPSSTGRGPGRAAAGRRQPYSTRRSLCSPPAGNTWTECSCWVTPTPGGRGGPVRTLVNRWMDDLKVPHLTIFFLFTESNQMLCQTLNIFVKGPMISSLWRNISGWTKHLIGGVLIILGGKTSVSVFLVMSQRACF